jgi:hypothetical protein
MTLLVLYDHKSCYLVFTLDMANVTNSTSLNLVFRCYLSTLYFPNFFTTFQNAIVPTFFTCFSSLFFYKGHLVLFVIVMLLFDEHEHSCFNWHNMLPSVAKVVKIPQ